MNIFEYASRHALRFATDKGALTTEQLWDLPLKSNLKVDLDGIAIAIAKELRDTTEMSFVESRPDPKKKHLEVKLEIVKTVIAYRQAENAERLADKERASEKQKILEVLDSKKADNLNQLSEDQLRARLAALGG